jgi:hypothetical protein
MYKWRCWNFAYLTLMSKIFLLSFLIKILRLEWTRSIIFTVPYFYVVSTVSNIKYNTSMVSFQDKNNNIKLSTKHFFFFFFFFFRRYNFREVLAFSRNGQNTNQYCYKCTWLHIEGRPLEYTKYKAQFTIFSLLVLSRRLVSSPSPNPNTGAILLS